MVCRSQVTTFRSDAGVDSNVEMDSHADTSMIGAGFLGMDTLKME